MNNRQSALTCKGFNTWLVGKLKCGNCGRALTIRNSKTKAGRYFICSSLSLSKNCGGPGTLYAAEIEDLFQEEIKGKLKEFTVLTKCHTPTINPDISQLKVKIAQLEREIDNWFCQAQFADRLLLKRINDKIATLDSQRAKLEEEIGILGNNELVSDIHKIRDFGDKWDDMGSEDKMRVADAVIRVAFIWDGGVEIAWKF